MQSAVPTVSRAGVRTPARSRPDERARVMTPRARPPFDAEGALRAVPERAPTTARGALMLDVLAEASVRLELEAIAAAPVAPAAARAHEFEAESARTLHRLLHETLGASGHGPDVVAAALRRVERFGGWLALRRPEPSDAPDGGARSGAMCAAVLDALRGMLPLHAA